MIYTVICWIFLLWIVIPSEHFELGVFVAVRLVCLLAFVAAFACVFLALDGNFG